MPDQLQLRGGTTTEHETFTGASKEVTIDTTKKTAVVHDASTAGGNPLMREDGANSALINGSATAPALAFAAGDGDNGIYSPGADQVAISTGGSGRLFVNASGNVGIGTTPNDVDSIGRALNIASSSGGAIYLQDTDSLTEKFAAISYNGSTTGLQIHAHHSSSFIDLGTNGTERARIDSSGRLGVGTSSPSQKLHVSASSGDVTALVECPGHPILRLKTTGTTDNTSVDFADSGSDTQCRLVYTHSTDLLRIQHSGNDALSINSSGNVGIGTTSPEMDLHVKDGNDGEVKIGGSSSATGLEIRYSNSGNTTTNIHQIYRSTSGSARLNIDTGTFTVSTGTSGSESARIDSSGRLLVGTSSAPSPGDGQYSVIVASGFAGGPTGAGQISIQRGVPATSITSGGQIGSLYFTDNAGQPFANISCEADADAGSGDYPGRLVFSTTADGASSPTERIRIDSAGAINLGGGANSGNNNVVVWPDIDSGGFAEVRKTSSAGNGDRFMSFKRNGTQIGSIALNGTSNTSFNTSSDYRLKENVAPVTNGIERLQQLKPARFNFISEPDRTIDGFIAHEVQDVVPEAITGEKDAVDDEGNPVYQGIDQSKLVPLLTAALQEAIAKIETLEQRLNDAGIS